MLSCFVENAPRTFFARRFAPRHSARLGAKGQYLGGAGLPVIAEPQGMFDDMLPKVNSQLRAVADGLAGRPIRIATMCSGTESPVLALDMIERAFESLNEDAEHNFKVEHVFSCEIEPYKQAYIERNFSPPLLFRDIRELGNKQVSECGCCQHHTQL